MCRIRMARRSFGYRRTLNSDARQLVTDHLQEIVDAQDHSGRNSTRFRMSSSEISVAMRALKFRSNRRGTLLGRKPVWPALEILIQSV
ncbi:MAG: hypothetical protein WCN98_12945 [Verrucomicrobiaceae bacterium]